MQTNMFDVIALQIRTSNCLICTFEAVLTLKGLIFVQETLYKMILKSIPKFSKASKI